MNLFLQLQLCFCSDCRWCCRRPAVHPPASRTPCHTASEKYTCTVPVTHTHTHSPTHYSTCEQWRAHTNTRRKTWTLKKTQTQTHICMQAQTIHWQTSTNSLLNIFTAELYTSLEMLYVGLTLANQPSSNKEVRTKEELKSSKDCKEIGLPYTTATTTVPW